ncbi:MAG: Pycsar system effector family protein [Pseudomonadota bacterium]
MTDTSKKPFDIETLDLETAIEGTEGLDVNHASRLRMQFLVSQHASLVTQTQFADAKAAAVMTLMGLVALNGPVKIGAVGAHDFQAIAIFVLMMAAIGLAIFAIIPRYPDARLNKLIKRRDRFSWPALVSQDYEPLDHAEFMRKSEATQLIMSLAQANGATARVLRRKFVFLRAAFILAALDLLLIVGHVVGLRPLSG